MKFNTKAQGTDIVLNHEGEKAYALKPSLELYAAVASAGLGDKFYRAEGNVLTSIRGLIRTCDPVFVARLAVYAREQLYLRSIPLVLAVELAAQHKGDDLVSRLVERIVRRADEITELLACYISANDRTAAKKLNKLSKQVQKGLAAAFNSFDEYQFAKYNRDAAVRLKDALFLVHPKAKDEAQQALFDKIVSDGLQTPYTWETQLSTLGQQAFESDVHRQAAFREKWEELIFSEKVGYMATLRNLRNILTADVSKEAIDKVCGFLSNAKAVAASKQLPFRFLSAYREISEVNNGYTGQVLDALEQAVMHSAVNIDGYQADTKVVIAADVSGSMTTPVSANSKLQYFDIGLVLAMLMQSRCANVVTGVFGDRWKVIGVPKTNILANVELFRNRANEVGYSTNGYLVIKDLLDRRQVVDKVLLFTDCQLWNSHDDSLQLHGLWKEYKQLVPGAKLYLFDLAGYGQAPLRVTNKDVFLIAGWSDKIFQVLHAIEEGSSALEKINTIEL